MTDSGYDGFRIGGILLYFKRTGYWIDQETIGVQYYIEELDGLNELLEHKRQYEWLNLLPTLDYSQVKMSCNVLMNTKININFENALNSLLSHIQRFVYHKSSRRITESSLLRLNPINQKVGFYNPTSFGGKKSEKNIIWK